jgi:hypothetical protein
MERRSEKKLLQFAELVCWALLAYIIFFTFAHAIGGGESKFNLFDSPGANQIEEGAERSAYLAAQFGNIIGAIVYGAITWALAILFKRAQEDKAQE